MSLEVGSRHTLEGVEFEVVSTTSNDTNNLVEYALVPVVDLEVVREAEKKAADEAAYGEAPDSEDAAPAVASEEPEILHPRG